MFISGQYVQIVIQYIKLYISHGVLLNLKLTLTSGQEAEVKSQSGHLKVFASKCALLWFSMSERPWKDSMHIRQENLLMLTVEGEAGVSLLSWWETGTVRERIYLLFFFLKQEFPNGFLSYLHLLKDTIRQSWSEVKFFTFEVFRLRHFHSWRTTSLSITAKSEVLAYCITLVYIY